MLYPEVMAFLKILHVSALDGWFLHFSSWEKRKRNMLSNTNIGTDWRDKWQMTRLLQRLLDDSYLAPSLFRIGSETKQEVVTVSLVSSCSGGGSPHTYTFKLNEKSYGGHYDVCLNKNLGCLWFRIVDNCLWNLSCFFWDFSKWKVTSL